MILVILSLKENIIEKKKERESKQEQTLIVSYSLEALARCEKC